LYKYSLEKNDEGWWYIMRELGFSQQLVTFVDNPKVGLRWLSEKGR
jgi:hypothetical protein